MKIALNEIWNFLDLIDKEKGWDFSLCAGDVVLENIDMKTMVSLKEDEYYDTELLPSLFTFREILWQPDVFTDASMSLPSLRILKAFCEETAQEHEENSTSANKVYCQLVKGLANYCGRAIETMDHDRVDVKKILGEFRKGAFPIIKFFIYHPKNRLDYYNDAVNRLNYAVKIMLTQFYGRYTELEDPYWKVLFKKKKAVSKEEVEQ